MNLLAILRNKKNKLLYWIEINYSVINYAY